MNYIDADELRKRLKDSESTPYDAKFCAMINELAVETDVDAEYYQNIFDKHCIINRVDSIEKINKAINWLMNNVRKAEDLSELCKLIELRRKIVRGID